jgi:hypothetical protein
VALPAAGTGTHSGSETPLVLLGFMVLVVSAGLAALLRTRAARPRS